MPSALATSSSSTTGLRVPLRSIERGMTLSDESWFMVAHIMVVQGQTVELQRHLPLALMKTFNKHPRMRLKMVKDAFAMGEVQMPVTLDGIATQGLLYIEHTDAQDLCDYQAFIQSVGHTPYDRYTQFAFTLHVWVDADNDLGQQFPPNKLQEDFRLVKPPNNPSTLLFADGSKENLARIVVKCREEGTTFFGAFAASIFLSFILISKSMDDEAFKIALYMNFNMRHRVANPIDPAAVGCFITASEMAVPTINVPSQKFWDLARDLKVRSEATATSFPRIALPLIMLDQHFSRESDPTLAEQFPIKASNLADVDISSLGKYPHAQKHAFRFGELSIEALNYTGHVPFLAAACLFYAVSVEQTGYSQSHHFEESTGQQLFDTAVGIMEGSWNIASHEKLVDIAAKLSMEC